MSDVTMQVARFATTAQPPQEAVTALRAAMPGAPAWFSTLAELGLDDVFTALDATAPADVAVAVGVEVAQRIHAALAGHVDGGWDLDSAAIVIGAAAAASRRLGLTPELAARALSIAATQVSGLEVLVDTGLGASQRQHARDRGVESARLAAAGLTAPVTGLEGRRGLFALLAPGAQPDAVVADLGTDWRLSRA